jgi:hypothetical protein
MSNWTKAQTLLRGFVILSVVVLAAFTTNGAWAATPTAGDVSGKRPPTIPQTDPLVNPCLANGVHSALYLSCLKNGSNLSSNTHVSQNGGSNSNSNSRTVTSNQSKIHNNSSSSSNNSSNLTQQLINIGKIPAITIKGSTQVSKSKGNDSSSTKNQSKLTVNNMADPALTTKDPSKLTTTKDPSKLTTNTKDPSKLNSTKVSDPPSSSTASRELSLIQRFERLTGHNLSSAQLKALTESGSLTSEGEVRFVQSLEKVTGHEINNTEVTQVEGSGSGSVNSEGEIALIQRFEKLTGHDLSSAQLTELEGSGSLSSEGETQFLASLEKVAGHELSNTEVTQVEGSGSINSEGESTGTQQVESATGQEVGSSESGSESSEGESAGTQEVENSTGEEVSSEESSEVEGSTSEEAEETSSEENAENVETTTTENNESTATQIAEGEIVPITGGVATTTSTILAGTVGSLNQTNGVDTFVIGSTNVRVNGGLSAANQIQNGLNVELGGAVDSNGTFVASSVMAVTNNAITAVSGTVSSLNETGSVDTFLIGNTTIQLGDSLEGTTEFTNGETIKLDGFFTGSENFVATSIVSVTQ